MSEVHIVEQVKVEDRKRFLVIVTKAPSGSRFQWAVAHGTNMMIGERVTTDRLNELLYAQVSEERNETSPTN